MAARNQLPRAVHAVGDRIGLDYNIDRKAELRKYVEQNQNDTRVTFDQLKNSFYALNESRTKKSGDQSTVDTIRKAKNPLKLNSKLRKQLYTLSYDEKQVLLYSTFVKVHELWQEYSKMVLSHSDPMSVFRMDLHGSKLKCSESRNPNLIGLEGIVVQETKNTFLIIKESNGLVTLPKRECKFEIKIDQNVYVINGANFLYTTQTRSKLKYKKKKS